ncbi:DUF4982 domain-containing protein [Lachnospiraceae bacterium OttesenSCG-928-D06]|nr:DUF4982 domain-containing protein [Lachnospiraceae bacterium OttesenSCG-928-D06]
MPRTEVILTKDWEFGFGDTKDCCYKKIELPHDWAISMPFNREMDQGEQQGFRDRWGIGWYKRTIHLEKKQEDYCYYLNFGGVYENCTIWVNEKEAGSYKYGYSSFKIDVTSFVQTGENQILLKVDNTVSPVDRWYSGAGIYRTVKWVELPKENIDVADIHVETKLNGADAIVTVHTGSNNKAMIINLSDGENEYHCDEKNQIYVKDARLWSDESPFLYTLTCKRMDGDCELDGISMRIGIREIQMIPNKGMYVNGKKVILKGVCLHQEAGCVGVAVRKELYRERLLMLKKMGCNSIRAAHHIFSEEFLDLCDEMGFFVYEECFDKWTGGLYGRYFETEWKKDVECMVKRDRNRPSIFIWGVGNEVENQAQDSMLSILKMLKAHILTMDETRPVTYAMNPHFKRASNVDLSKIKDIQQFVDEADDTEIYDAVERVERIKLIADIVDVISCNYQEQWYDMIHEQTPDKLILGTEVYQYFMGHRDQMQNFTVKNPALVPFQKDYCIGSMVWTGYDYLGESMGYPAKGWGGAIIRTNGVVRPSFYMMQSYWTKEPMVHFSVMDYSLTDEGVKEHWDLPMYADHWHFPQFHKTVIPYIISSNCDEVALFLNGKHFHVAKPAECENGIVSGFIPWQPGCVKVVGYNNGVEVCSHTTVTPGPAVKLAFLEESKSVLAEEGYQMLLTVHATDEQGTHYLRESAKVSFRVEGEAEILAVDNGDLMGNEPYQERFIHMYRGYASVLIRLTGKKGRVSLFADAEGMHSGQMVISVE